MVLVFFEKMTNDYRVYLSRTYVEGKEGQGQARDDTLSHTIDPGRPTLSKNPLPIIVRTAQLSWILVVVLNCIIRRDLEWLRCHRVDRGILIGPRFRYK